jgi:rod shape-determining protein MreC
MGKLSGWLLVKQLLKFSPLILLIFFLLAKYKITDFDQLFKTQVSSITGPIINWQNNLLTRFTDRNLNNLNSSNSSNHDSKIISQLTASNQQLEQKIAQLLQENIALQASLKYTDDITELLEFKKQYNFITAIPAQIIFKNFSSAEQFFYLNCGAEQGVTLNMVAFYDNCIIGRISAVYPTYSKLILITDKSCKIAAYCSQSRISGVFHGLNNIKQATLKHVHHMFELINGDLVLSSGEGLIFPQGFALGVIKEFSCQGVDYDVLIEPVIDLDKLKYCLLK